MTSNSLDRDFSKKFGISLGVHLICALIAFAGGEILNKVFPNKDVEIIRSSVRVDVVGMPKFTVQELKKMEAQPIVEKEPEVAKGVKEETKPEQDDVIKKDDLVILEQGKKKTSFLNMINEASSTKVTAKKVEKQGAKTGTGNKNLDSLIIEGNRLSKGSALVGDYTDEQNSEFSAYVQSLPGIIRPFWKLPTYLLEKELKARIKIYISPEGKLLKADVQESSGSDEFDARALSAVKSGSVNFPKPSAEVGARLTSSGIILGFPL